MSPGAVWWGNYLFRDTWKIPAGEMTATAPIRWSDEDPGFTGDEGGGLWGVSHPHQGQAAREHPDLREVRHVSDPRWQVELSTGLPAYTAPQQAWLDKGAKDGYFADYPTTAAAMVAAGNAVRPQPLLHALQHRRHLEQDRHAGAHQRARIVSAAWEAFGTQLVNEAKTFGYEVVDTGN